MDWSPQQAAALAAVDKWVRDRRAPQIFRLFGYAGTGKTTLAKHIAAGIDGQVLFAAFTGKAALVLRKKGCGDASTIHSLIYKVEEDEDGGDPVFTLNPDSMVRFARLVIIDECSMVDAELGRDLLSFGTKILVLGDPAQLPPVKGDGFFTNGEPDFMLTEIHRQAADNPIIRLSMDVRAGRRLAEGTYGDSRIIRRAGLGSKQVLAADQVLVGLNKTRQAFNTRIRQLQGRTSDMPEPGDRLVCLKNNREKGLLNGSLWTADAVTLVHDRVSMAVKSLDGMDDPGELSVPRQFFLGTEKELEWHQRKHADEMCFGYALTVHKSQGSAWDHVMLFDESATFREDRVKHLYTGITRAAERVTIVL
jgi:exodeoxyribonuclease-5